MDCENCGKPVKKNASKYCSNLCQQDYQKKTIIKAWKEDSTKGTKSGGRLKASIRNYILDKFENKCSRCGWNEINPITQKSPLEIDHINGDSSDNSEENLIVLCPNCHSLTPTWKALNRGRGNKERLRYSGL